MNRLNFSLFEIGTYLEFGNGFSFIGIRTNKCLQRSLLAIYFDDGKPVMSCFLFCLIEYAEVNGKWIVNIPILNKIKRFFVSQPL